MARSRSALRPRLRLLVAAATWALATAPADAVPTNCPSDLGIATCVVTVGDTSVSVDAEDRDLVVYDWLVGGVGNLFEERFPILDVLAFPQQAFDLRLDSATADDATATIEVRFVEAQGVFHASATFTLTDTPDGAVLDESLVLDSFSVTRATRLYAVTDFDVNETPSDDSILASESGTLVIQTDGDVTAVSEAGDPPPDAFQVALSSTLSELAMGNTFFQLDGTTSVPGPDDFASGLSWNRTLGPGNAFTVALRRQITVPEPTVVSSAAASILALLALRAARGSRRASSDTPHSAVTSLRDDRERYRGGAPT
jgi:hypothetical protein